MPIPEDVRAYLVDGDAHLCDLRACGKGPWRWPSAPMRTLYEITPAGELVPAFRSGRR